MHQPSMIGIDLGSQTSVIAMTKAGGVEILANEASNRETPNIVGFGDNERFLGEQGLAQMKSNFKNTIVYPLRFLALTANSAAAKQESKWLYCPISKQENKIAFEVKYTGEKTQFTAEQVLAMMLQKLKKTLAANNLQDNAIVLSVPCYFTQQERLSLQVAAKVAGLFVIKLVNESTAVALSYGIFRRSTFDEVPRNVCFVDVGHSKSSVYVVAFTKDKATIMNQYHDRDNGARDFDWNMFEFYCQKFEKENGINLRTKEKSRMRMLDAIEKQRKILSANSESSINVEYVAEDLDFNHNMTRLDFEKINQEPLNRFRALLQKLKSEGVEIIGGATRMPALQKIVQDVFGLECSRTLHATECVAKGAAIQSLMLAPGFKAAKFEVDEVNYYPIKCSWTFFNEAGKESFNVPQDQSVQVFPKGCPIMVSQTIKVTRDDPKIEFTLSYDPPHPGKENELDRMIVFPIKSKAPYFILNIRVFIDGDGIVGFDQGQTLEEFAEGPNVKSKGFTDKIKGFFGKDKETKPASVSELKFEVLQTRFISEKELIRYVTSEREMATRDDNVLLIQEKRNELEGITYDLNHKITDTYAKYLSQDQKISMIFELENTKKWIEGEGAKAPLKAYIDKIDYLSKSILGQLEYCKGMKNFRQDEKLFEDLLIQYENIQAALGGEWKQEVQDQLRSSIQDNREFLKRLREKSVGFIIEQKDLTEMTTRRVEFLNKFSKLVQN